MTRAVQQYRLCALCAERQGEEARDSVKIAGTGCYICGGMMDRVPLAIRAVVRSIRRYHFRTFAVGVSMPEGVQEREDELRADLKLKGMDTARTQVARLIAGGVAPQLRKKVDRVRPDLMVVVDMAGGGVQATSRPLFYYGRYTKPPGVSQKREPCRECFGRGCKACRNTGFEDAPSVDGQLRKRFARECGSDRMKFTWLGSEDRESRVYPPGRPFVAEVKNPVRRALRRRFSMRTGGGTVAVSRGKLLPSRPISLPSFRFRTAIVAVSSAPVREEDLREVGRRFRRTEVRFDRPYERPTTKTVYRAAARKRGKTLTIDAVLDGGLPVKRFVSGELVSPSVSEVLKTEVRCRTFDIREVKETGAFGFAKVTRL